MAESKRTLCLDDRKLLRLEGVKEVVSFDETGAVLITENGELTVEGTGIKISNLDTDRGEVEITGRIDAMIYSLELADKKRGLRSRLFG